MNTGHRGINYHVVHASCTVSAWRYSVYWVLYHGGKSGRRGCSLAKQLAQHCTAETFHPGFAPIRPSCCSRGALPPCPLIRFCSAESIAFYTGEVREAGVASGRLASLVSLARLRIKWSAWLSLWTNCYSYATILAPAFITAPMYFRGEIEFGTISQVLPCSALWPLSMPALGCVVMAWCSMTAECSCGSAAALRGIG